MNDYSKKIALYGFFTALSLVLSYAETLIPVSLPVPGAKIGLANIVTVFCLYTLTAKETILVSVLRVLLQGFLFGNLFAIIYSLAGCLFSFAVMILLKRSGRFSPVGVSAAGGVFHNAGQLAAAAALCGPSVFAYLPYLFAAGILSGIIIGIAGGIIVQRIKNVVK